MGNMRLYVFEFPLDGTLPMSIETVRAVLGDAPQATMPPANLVQNPPIVTPHKPRIPTAESKTATPPERPQEAPTPAQPHRPSTIPPIGERGMDYAADAAAFLPKEFKAATLLDKMLALGWKTQAKEPIQAVKGILTRDMRFFYNVRKKVWTFRETSTGANKGQ